ncbi:MAG: glycoside hydrolase family 57 protein, partial [Mucinivorans sp.]
MKKLCLYFQVHQPYRLKKYRFFNMGKDHFYFDDFLNRTVLQRVAAESYLPMNELLLKMIEKYGDAVQVSFSLSGPAIEQFEQWAPEVLDSFKRLAATGNVEFLAETYSHSLASLKNRVEFENQVIRHGDKIEALFGTRPRTFRNTELIYSDHIGDMVEQMGFDTILTEGAKQILGWKSPNFIYSNPLKQNIKLLLRNYKLSDDIAFRFGNQGWCEYPLTAQKYLSWLVNDDNKGDVINLFMDYETFGEHVKAKTGIFPFMEELISQIVASSAIEMATPAKISEHCQSVALLHVPHPISWAD